MCVGCIWVYLDVFPGVLGVFLSTPRYFHGKVVPPGGKTRFGVAVPKARGQRTRSND